jgi:predicted glycosyltransferase involved in capsule biosynthesis
VRLTDSKILILLDSDRVLPENYFSDLVQTIKPNEVITTVNLFGLIKDYTDQEIESNDFVSYPDFRSTEVAVHKKNLFSGNTVMFTDDYWRCGGMDEEFIGYGFADNDMTQRAIHNRLLPVYLTHKELHLYHPREIQWNNASIDGSLVFQVITLINCVRYLKKWTLPVPQFIKDQISSVDKSHLPSDVAAMYEQVVENKYFMV